MERYLPNAERAYVEPAKVRDYLLVFRETSDKSEFFQRFGFRREQWQVLQEARVEHGRSHPVVGIKQRPFGVHYVVEGPLRAADGRRPIILSIWEIRPGAPVPRLVSAYPS